jgi:hypothetical protein
MNNFEDKRNGQGQNPSGINSDKQSSANAGPSYASGNHNNDLSQSERSSSIGQALKSVYQQTVEEDLPQDFQNLLDQLK